MKFFAVFLSLMVSYAEARIEMSLPAEVHISAQAGLEFTDIAEFKELSRNDYAQLEKITLMSIPDRPQEEFDLIITKKEILQWLKHEDLRSLNLRPSIPEQIKIKVTQSISSEEIQRKLRHQVQLICANCEVEAEMDRVPQFQSKNWKFEFGDFKIRSSMMVSGLAGQTLVWIPLKMKIYQMVPMTTKWLVPSQKIAFEDLQMQRVNIANLKGQFVDSSELVGQLAQRSISPGSPLSSADVRRDPIVKRGQIVNAIMTDGAFEISAQMVAEESGFVGDTIKVKNSETKKILPAKIQNESNVVIK